MKYPCRSLVCATLLVFVAGCATTATENASAEKFKSTTQESAVGSRIRRAQKQPGPTQEIGQEDLDQLNQRTTAETIKTLQAGRGN